MGVFFWVSLTPSWHHRLFWNRYPTTPLSWQLYTLELIALDQSRSDKYSLVSVHKVRFQVQEGVSVNRGCELIPQPPHGHFLTMGRWNLPHQYPADGGAVRATLFIWTIPPSAGYRCGGFTCPLWGGDRGRALGSACSPNLVRSGGRPPQKQRSTMWFMGVLHLWYFYLTVSPPQADSCAFFHFGLVHLSLSSLQLKPGWWMWSHSLLKLDWLYCLVTFAVTVEFPFLLNEIWIFQTNID
jgi:hypothetical protein